eukprot:403376420
MRTKLQAQPQDKVNQISKNSKQIQRDSQPSKSTSTSPKSSPESQNKQSTVTKVTKKKELKPPKAPKPEKKESINLKVLLANTYDPDKLPDPTGWYMSEKLDGVRCYWDGKGNLYSRNGKVFYPPKYFVDELPQGFELDGELWTKRDDFQKCVSIVKRQDENDEWKSIKYMIFDAPGMKESGFSERYKKICQIVSKSKSQYLVALEHRICEGREDLMQEMERITSAGGEGVMLREPNSLYEQKRSNNLLKVKNFDDAEALIIGHEPGEGRLKGLLGALRVRDDEGKEFKIGSGFNDAQRADPPKIGQRVTFKYMGKSKGGIPRFPIYLRVHLGL